MEQKTSDVLIPSLEIGSSSTSNEEEVARPMSPPVHGLRTHNPEDGVVGFKDEAITIMERLTGGKPKHLEVISIVGMPGIGKSTLANKVYNDPYVRHHFYIRAWISISHVYQERNLLLGILRSPNIQPSGDLDTMTDEKLREELHKCLKGKKYLIVLDDISDIEAWELLKRKFPNDNIGSRIMITTRYKGVALHAGPGSHPLYLRSLSKEESWDLFEEKVFQNGFCPQELMHQGKKIVEKCQGLPLAIVVIGGLLAKTEKTEYKWNQVAERISSYIASDREQFMKTLELSYTYLPDILKPCFVYFGAFPEDYEIPVSKLIFLWMAEGFIVKSGDVTLEDAAEDYLRNLLERSLILVASRSSNGEVKSCRIHDLLRDLCLRKAEEDNFMRKIDRYGQVSSIISSSSSSFSSSPITNISCRLCISSHFLDGLPFKRYRNIYSLLFFDTTWVFHKLTIFQNFKSLRVLDFSHVRLEIFPTEIEQLIYLRYLSLQVNFNELPGSLSNLRNLETLVVEGLVGAISVDVIYKMKKLRHVHVNPCASMGSDDSIVMAEIQTISTPIFSGGNWLSLKSTPNLRKLKCDLLECFFHPMFRGLEFLDKLEKLKMYDRSRTCCDEWIDFPSSLKEITLSNFGFDWKYISKLARLPNLEVLKLQKNAFQVRRRHTTVQWDTIFEESDFQPFPKLKFLKFDSLNITQWNASSDHLPNLRRLVLKNCSKLEEIPSDLGEIPTLEMIELNWCSRSEVDSAREIQEEQEGMANEKLKILVYPPDL